MMIAELHKIQSKVAACLAKRPPDSQFSVTRLALFSSLAAAGYLAWTLMIPGTSVERLSLAFAAEVAAETNNVFVPRRPMTVVDGPKGEVLLVRNQSRLRILHGCEGIDGLWLISAYFLTASISWARRLKYAGIGAAISYFFLNNARILALSYLADTPHFASWHESYLPSLYFFGHIGIAVYERMRRDGLKQSDWPRRAVAFAGAFVGLKIGASTFQQELVTPIFPLLKWCMNEVPYKLMHYAYKTDALTYAFPDGRDAVRQDYSIHGLHNKLVNGIDFEKFIRSLIHGSATDVHFSGAFESLQRVLEQYSGHSYVLASEATTPLVIGMALTAVWPLNGRAKLLVAPIVAALMIGLATVDVSVVLLGNAQRQEVDALLEASPQLAGQIKSDLLGKAEVFLSNGEFWLSLGIGAGILALVGRPTTT